MRVGVIVSIIGHIGAVLMTFLAWEARGTLVEVSSPVVPVEIVAVAPEANVRALAEDVPDEDASPVPEISQEAVPEPTPTAAAPPRRQPPRPAFDLNDAEAGLRDYAAREGRQRREGERADRNQTGAGLGTEERTTLEARVQALARAHLRRCWRMPIDLPDPERLVVQVEFDLNRNGTLNGQPRVVTPRNYTFDPEMRTAVDAALRAVRTCDPYPFADDPVVGDHYEIWREMDFTFRPTQ
ncbi:hypothetical protein [Terricaulis sp.]|uniref:hypothetical protein n=1 Tax=Terricaulis sp. TaxID=2768686 RepID=UPI003782DEEF